ncbi:DUF4874 domain-containing protein [Flavobacterium sp. TAB 87]|uniref:DUF4874 domain-containing protein n=1 Tax=Flavobacterium sp. TAB 87 TaxID=1729581 RepID=UPI00076C0450|nr:DUF4874 domain-containing protein [Flavobacterium sp. TAB 87]KVV15141.1 hypothetical protein AP058_01243 [Flavobacterium sp. TAB 87]
MKPKILLILTIFLYSHIGKAQNLISNSSFDTGGDSSFILAPWIATGNAGVWETEHSSSKPKAVKLTGTAASIEQLVSGLTPNTIYRFSAWVYTTGSNKARLGVKNYLTPTTGDSTIDNSIAGYQFLELEFTTGASATSAKVYFYTNQTYSVYGDDFALEKLPIAIKTNIANGGFEDGTLQNWLSNGKQSYCDSKGADPGANRWISSLSTTGAVSNITSYSASSYPINGYNQYSDQTLLVAPNSTFTLNITNTNSTRYSRIKAWIDWNGDGDFLDSGEELFFLGNASTDNIASTVTISKNITVPALATLGASRLRIRFEDAWAGVPVPCNFSEKSSTFDFKVIVSNGGSTPTESITTTAVSSEVHSGAFAAKIAGEAATVNQNNLKLKAGTSYLLKAWAKVGTSNAVTVGIKNFTGGILSSSLVASTSSTSYQELSVPFTTGVFPQDATVFFQTTSSGTAFFDDFTITQLSSLSPLDESFVSKETLLSNPERGFRFEQIVQAPDLNDPWGLAIKYDVNTVLTDIENQMDATDGHVRLSQWYIYLSQYKDGPLPQVALDAVQKCFDAFKNKGYKMVLRFVYQAPEAEAPYTNIIPSTSRILGHLDQLKPLVQANIGVIHTLQMGLIGAWGEWHSFGNAYNQTDKNNLVAKLLEVLPADRQTQMRTAGDRNAISTAIVSTAIKDARIGFHNDFFGDSKTYSSTSSGYYGSDTYNLVKDKSYNLLIDGEPGWSRDCKSNSDCIWQVSELFDVYEVLKQLTDHHYTSFSLAHGYNANNAYWKRFLLSQENLDALKIPYHPSYFKNNVGSSVNRTAYEFIRDHLGYRLYVSAANQSLTQNGNILNYSVDIQNYGFSSLHNPREVNVVLLDAANNVIATSLSSANSSTWQPYTPGDANHTILTHTISGTMTLPANIVTASNYKIGIWLTDPVLKNNKKFDIQLANRTGMTVFENNTQKINIYKTSVSLTAVTNSSHCEANNAKFGNESSTRKEYYIKSFSTSGGVENISYSNGTYPTSLGDGHGEHSASLVSVASGSSFSFTMQNNIPASGELHARLIGWIDLNGDGDFNDSGEQLFTLGGSAQNNRSVLQNIVRSITIPAGTIPGIKRMRFRMRDSWVDLPTACGSNTIATAYDFFINVTGQTLGISSKKEKSMSDEENSSTEVKLYPNPFQNILQIDSAQGINSVKIYNVVGQEVYSQDDTNNKRYIEIASNALAPGVYLIKVEDRNGHITSKKVIKK